MKLVIFGAGYSGAAIGRRFVKAGHTVVGTTRSEEKLAGLTTAGMKAMVFDGRTFSADLLSEMVSATHLVQSIAPGEKGDPLLALVGSDVKVVMPKLAWIGYLSTVGVYGDHGGEWVTEETPCRPVSRRSVERLQAEDGWLAVQASSDISLAILRLSGIYGPGRNGFVNLAKGTARRLVKKGQVFNRIRVEDIAEATLFLAQGNTGGIFNVTDDEPAPPQDVVLEAARLMAVEPPPEQDFETAELGPMARSFYGENKRVSNGKLKAEGFHFLHPDYRTSLRQLWTDNVWNHGI